MSPGQAIGRWRWNSQPVLLLAAWSAFGIGFMATCFALAVEPLTTLSGGKLPAAIIAIVNQHKNMSTKSPECWANDNQARAVRIEISPEQSLLLPHDDFAFAELKREGKEQVLRLVFAMHEVMVRGYSLRRIETAMQRMELSLLTKLPSSQRSLIADGQPVVLEIVVTETTKQESQPVNSSN